MKLGKKERLMDIQKWSPLKQAAMSKGPTKVQGEWVTFSIRTAEEDIIFQYERAKAIFYRMTERETKDNILKIYMYSILK